MPLSSSRSSIPCSATSKPGSSALITASAPSTCRAIFGNGPTGSTPQFARRAGRLPHSARRRMRHHHLRSAQDRHHARRRQPCPAASRSGCATCSNPIGILTLFIIYQIYRFYDTQSLGLIVLTVFDLFVMVLIWHEYGLMRRHHLVPPRTAS